MKTIQTPADREVPEVTIAPELAQYRGKILFPKKLALAKEKLKNVRLPAEWKAHKQ